MKLEAIIAEIAAYAPAGFLKTGKPDAIRRRINSLAAIEFKAQEAREALEEALDEAEKAPSAGSQEKGE